MSLFNGRYQSPRKTDGTINSGGKVYFYETGTSTLKSVYSDEALTTAHTNPVILDSNGTELIFLGTGSYDYKVDDSDDAAVVTSQGPVTSKDTSPTYVITTAITWTVDGAGSTDTTFVTLESALDESREYTIYTPGTLTIKINAGSFIESGLDFSHPQGNLLSVKGYAEGSTYLYVPDGTSSPLVHLTDGFILNELSDLTIKTSDNDTSMLSVIRVDAGAKLLNLNVTIVGRQNGQGTIPIRGLYVLEGGYVGLSGSFIAHSVYTGVYVESGGEISGLSSISYFSTSESFTPNEALHVRETGRVDVLGVSCYGSSSFNVGYGVRAENGAKVCIQQGGGYAEYTTRAFYAINNSTITIQDEPTFGSGVGTQYTPAKNTVGSVAAGSADLSVITVA